MEKILALESLRGLAALIVVLTHFGYAFYPAMLIGGTSAVIHSRFEQIILHSPFNILISGQFAVICFFVLSGFVLSYGYFSKAIDLVTATIKRYFRLAPVVFVSVLLSYFLLKLGLYQNISLAAATQSDWLEQFWKIDITLRDALWQGIVGTFVIQPQPTTSLNPLLWTIYYELIGSLLIFAFLGLAGKDRRRWILYGIFALVFLNTYYFAFIVGMLLCDLFVHRQESFRAVGYWRKGYKIAMLVGGIVLASYPSYLASGLDLGIVPASLILFPESGLNQNILYTTASVIFIVLLLTSHRIKTILERKVFVALGSMSYSLYATHLLILGSVGASFFLWFQSFLPYNAAALATFPCFLAAAILVAYLFRRYVDEPSILLSRNIVTYLKLDTWKHRKDDSVETIL